MTGALSHYYSRRRRRQTLPGRASDNRSRPKAGVGQRLLSIVYGVIERQWVKASLSMRHQRHRRSRRHRRRLSLASLSLAADNECRRRERITPLDDRLTAHVGAQQTSIPINLTTAQCRSIVAADFFFIERARLYLLPIEA